MKLPEHEILYLEHNPHKESFLTVEQFLTTQIDWGYEWWDDSSKMRSITTNDIWILHWHPRTTVSFYAIAAPTLEELFKLADTRRRKEV